MGGADDAVDAVVGFALFVNAILQEPKLLYRMVGGKFHRDERFMDEVQGRLPVEVYEHVFENPARSGQRPGPET